MADFYFIRHGEADYSEINTKIYKNQGCFMCTLTDKGAEQARLAAKDERLSGTELILTSPFGRALHTAAILSKELGAEIKVETDLHEWLADAESYDYLDDKTACSRYRELTELGGRHPEGVKKQWESTEMMKKRVFAVLDKYGHFGKVAVVSHGTLMQYCLSVKHPENCEIIKFER